MKTAYYHLIRFAGGPGAVCYFNRFGQSHWLQVPQPFTGLCEFGWGTDVFEGHVLAYAILLHYHGNAREALLWGEHFRQAVLEAITVDDFKLMEREVCTFLAFLKSS